ncbi:nicotinate-nucleotide--dimethylbenzimidazole phosphoribosyltransferase [Streptomyces sp. NPDC006186]|uniref:nicotinate-nucleotide--dimethylbenzimidazole phosphoribosyltransferase n=1 Tax=Streptomyces sp. NPDC006186 TaxID=3155248 RepID=UPI0033AD179A
MTDTGQVPGEGLPENAGTVDQPGVAAPAAYSHHLSETTATDEDLLLPGSGGAWGNEVAPPAPEPVVEAVHEPGSHELSGRDSGSVDLGGVRLPNPTPRPTAPTVPIPPITPRRPLHLGPPIPDTSSSPVRSLADRGPAEVPVRQPGPPTVGPEYLDVPPVREAAPQGAAPWGAAGQAGPGAVGAPGVPGVTEAPAAQAASEATGAPVAAVASGATAAETVAPVSRPEPVGAAEAVVARLTSEVAAATGQTAEAQPAEAGAPTSAEGGAVASGEGAAVASGEGAPAASGEAAAGAAAPEQGVAPSADGGPAASAESGAVTEETPAAIETAPGARTQGPGADVPEPVQDAAGETPGGDATDAGQGAEQASAEPAAPADEGRAAEASAATSVAGAAETPVGEMDAARQAGTEDASEAVATDAAQAAGADVAPEAPAGDAAEAVTASAASSEAAQATGPAPAPEAAPVAEGEPASQGESVPQDAGAAEPPAADAGPQADGGQPAEAVPAAQAAAPEAAPTAEAAVPEAALAAEAAQDTGSAEAAPPAADATPATPDAPEQAEVAVPDAEAAPGTPAPDAPSADASTPVQGEATADAPAAEPAAAPTAAPAAADPATAVPAPSVDQGAPEAVGPEALPAGAAAVEAAPAQDAPAGEPAENTPVSQEPVTDAAAQTPAAAPAEAAPTPAAVADAPSAEAQAAPTAPEAQSASEAQPAAVADAPSAEAQAAPTAPEAQSAPEAQPASGAAPAPEAAPEATAPQAADPVAAPEAEAPAEAEPPAQPPAGTPDQAPAPAPDAAVPAPAAPGEQPHPQPHPEAQQPAPTPDPASQAADANVRYADLAPQPVGQFVPVEGSVPTTPHLAPTPPHAMTLPTEEQVSGPVTVPAPRGADAGDTAVQVVQNADDLRTTAADEGDENPRPGPDEAAATQAPAPPAGPAAPGYDDAEREAVLKVMRERRDIRNGFRSDPIPHEVLLRVLEAAHHAPSVGHSQPWDFVVIRSAETRRTMHELAMRQREAYAKSLPKGRAKQFKELKIEAILDTPVNIVVTADPTRGGRHTLGRHTQPQMAPYSAALAVENLWLAARAEGLGVGWVSFFDEREMVRALGLPEHLEVIAYLCVGYVDEFPDEPELMQAGWSKRRPLSWVVHEETYGRRALPGEEPHDLLAETVAQIRPLDAKALGEAWERQKRMTKPAGALGMLEIISAQLCGLSRQCPPPIPEPAAVAIFAGDHGVHAQGVTPWPQEVTAQMVANFLGGGAVCNAFANQVGAEVCVVDVGVAGDLPATPGLLPRKIRGGTSDMTTGPAMTREEAKKAIEVGIETARDLVAAGNKALLTGEMGIANTTASAALISVFAGADPAEVTGRGTGINDETLARKTDVVRRALEFHRPDPADPIGVLAAVGGFEHAAMVGLLLGGASLRTPVVLDGVSAGAAALVARAIAPEVLAACIAGHRSAEPGHVAALNKLGLRPLVDLDLRLGEGTGALLALPLVQSTARAMHEVATFDSAGVTEK